MQSIGQIDISQARQQTLGSVVTVKGTILSGSEVGFLRYVQDGTAGIALYDGNSSISIQNLDAGDEVQVTGKLTEYKGLLEIGSISAVDVISKDNPLPTPKTIDLVDLGTKYESELVKVTCTHINEIGNFQAYSYELTNSSGDQGNIYVPGNSSAIGLDIPTGSFDLIGISSVFDDPQILLTDINNIQDASCLSFVAQPYESNIKTHSITLNYESNISAIGNIYLGTDPNNLNLHEVYVDNNVYSKAINGLIPSTVYYVHVELEEGLEQITSKTLVFCTASESSGEIEVYFNNPVDVSFSDGSQVSGENFEIIEQRLFELIDSAEESIDVAMYNNNRTSIVTRLTEAYNKGIQVRYITDDGTGNTALDNVPFEVITDESEALMHNKFMIVDVNIPEKVMVVQGSMNFTNNQIINDPNNLVFIQDQSLARAYQLEFNEMWGSNGPNPNLLTSRFGKEKTDNTPHHFNINGTSMELYFSPTDKTTSRILESIYQAEHTIDVALLTFTHNDLGNAIINQRDQGVSPRVIMEDYDVLGSEFSYLTDHSIPTANHPQSSIFHHKYALIDEGYPTAKVVSGSHNWTYNAEQNNDENVLVFHSQTIANLFKQEFEGRWATVVSNDIINNTETTQIWPNPFIDELFINSQNDFITYRLFSVSGEIMQEGNFSNSLSLKELAEGVYVLKLIGSMTTQSFKLVKQTN